MSKKAIPQATRRAVAKRAGAEPGTVTTAFCIYCGAKGEIHWITPGWVVFRGLELDHFISEHRGGDSSPYNIVLACRPCNRRKGSGSTLSFMLENCL